MLQWNETGGICENSAVTVCSDSPGDKLLLTQPINKSLPAPDIYPVRIFVNISYSYMDCPTRTPCNYDLQLEMNSGGSPLSADGIMPDSRIRDGDGSEMQFYFDLDPHENDLFHLVLVSRPMTYCVTVSRVLVYRYECPGHERQSAGIARHPATQAPVNETVSVTSQCAENAHHTELSQPNSLFCSSEGKWNNDQTVCECDWGYYRDDDVCKGNIGHVF